MTTRQPDAILTIPLKGGSMISEWWRLPMDAPRLTRDEMQQVLWNREYGLRSYLGEAGTRAQLGYYSRTQEVGIARKYVDILLDHIREALLRSPDDEDSYVLVRWQVKRGTGTCNVACWEATRLSCSCVCGGERHASFVKWNRTDTEWLEGRIYGRGLFT